MEKKGLMNVGRLVLVVRLFIGWIGEVIRN